MLSISSSSLTIWNRVPFRTTFSSHRNFGMLTSRTHCSLNNKEHVPLEYDIGFDADLQPRNGTASAVKLKSWFGPNGQYIRESPCPSCRGRGYAPCTECGVERPRSDCTQCDGKGLKSCRQCLGDCVIWEESVDEGPWEKVQSSSLLKMKEDDEVDKLDVKVDVTRKSKRIYPPSTPEINMKISRSLKSLNTQTGLFTNLMKMIHQDPVLNAKRIAAIKKTRGTDESRKKTSEIMKAYFRNPENRLKRSIALKEAKFCCSHCGEEGHRRNGCPILKKTSGKLQLKCKLCGKKGHNRLTCGRERKKNAPPHQHHCKLCGQTGHNSRTCSKLTPGEPINFK